MFIVKPFQDWQHPFTLFKLIHDIRFFVLATFLLLADSAPAIAAKTHTFEAEKGTRIGGAFKLADRGASGGASVALTNSGQGIKFTRLPAANKLAIRYASVGVGTISVAVNDQPARKVNVHSSGGAHQFFSQRNH